MSEIDLIPDEYLHWQAQKRVLRQAGVLGVALIALLMLVVFGLQWHNAQTEQELKRLQADKSISARQQQRLEALVNDHNRFDSQWQLLNGLRGGTRAEAAIAVIDQVLQGDAIWFKDWRFKRSGSNVEPEFIEADKGTYVIQLTTGRSSVEGPASWAIDTSLNIKGGAEDHAAFSRFVQSLLLQREVADVRILSTSSSSSAEATNQIEFEIDVLVNGKMAGDTNA